jgi:hypothetical protein
MRNHFHLVVVTPQGNLVAGMRGWCLETPEFKASLLEKWSAN